MRSENTLEQAEQIDAICDDYERNWSASVPLNLAEYFRSHAPSGQNRELLRELLLLDRELRSKHGLPNSLADYQAMFPDNLHELGAVWSELEPTLLIETRAESTLGMSGTRLSRDGQPGMLRKHELVGNYEILEELGRGGMGIVYRAIQHGAKRDVAIKLIRADYLGNLLSSEQHRLIQRFQNEALATARIVHPNVITVYEVGEHQSLPFFSMQLARGETLAAMVAKGPLESRVAADYLEQAARGVQSAHELGILHRDLTPRNILFDSATQRPLVADFGLAKLLDAAQAQTNNGALMGSPPYMSPEQVKDCHEVSAATDIYGLGATLYHLVTGRPPFLAATPAATLYQVVNELPVLPRELNPGLERDIETICMKCLHKDPQQRYSTAKDLADDLQRFIDRRPIRARPIGSTERLWRWCMQNQGIASVFVVIFALLTIASLVASQGWIAARRNQQLAESRQAEALYYFKIVCQTVDETVDWISRDPRLKAHGLEAARRQQLERAATCYEQLVTMRPDDPELLSAQGRAFFQLGQINQNLQAFPAAEKSLTSAIRIQQQLHELQPERTDWLRHLAASYAARGNVLLNLGRVAAAEKDFQASAADRTELLDKLEQDPQAWLDAVSSENDQGRLLEARGNIQEAARVYRRAIGMLDQTPPAENSPNQTKLPLVRTLTNLARVLAQQVELREATQNYDRAIELLQGLQQENKNDPEFLELLVLCYNNQADLLQKSERLEDAEQAYTQAIAMLQNLVKAHPDNDYYQFNLTLTQQNLATFYEDVGQYDRAQELLEKSFQEIEALCHAQPQSLEYRRQYGLAHLLSAKLQAQTDDPQRSLQDLQLALHLFEALATEAPDLAQNQHELANCLSLLGVEQMQQKQWSAAEQSLDRALRLRQKLLAMSPQAIDLQFEVAASLVNQGCLYSQLERPAAAETAFHQAAAIYDGMAHQQEDRYLRHCSIIAKQNLCYLYLNGQRYELAKPCAEQVTAGLEKLCGDDPRHPLAEDLLDHYCLVANLQPNQPDSAALLKAQAYAQKLFEHDNSRRRLMQYWQIVSQLAELAEQSHDYPQALAALQRIVRFAKPFVEEHPEDAYARHRLVRCLLAAAKFAAQLQQPDQALAILREASAMAKDHERTSVELAIACLLVKSKQPAAAAAIAAKVVPGNSEDRTELARYHCLHAAATPAMKDRVPHYQAAEEQLQRALDSHPRLLSALRDDPDFAELARRDWWKQKEKLVKQPARIKE